MNSHHCCGRSEQELKMTKDVEAIANSGIQAVHPTHAVRKVMKWHKNDDLMEVDGKIFDLKIYHQVILVAFGKASRYMAKGVVDTIEHTKTKIEGLVVAKEGGSGAEQDVYLAARNIRVYEAGHPIPDVRSLAAAKRILELVGKGIHRKLVIVCVSGGGSTLFCSPRPSLSLDDLVSTNNALLQSGMNISDINTVRKRLELGKGGGLAARISGEESDLISLVLSDVIGDSLDIIASGPTVRDSSTGKDAYEVMLKLPDTLKLPSSVVHLLESEKNETSPSSSSTIFDRSTTVLVGTNSVAIQAAAMKAKALGYVPWVLGTRVEGEAKEVARVFCAIAQHAVNGPNQFSVVDKCPAVLLFGGETTVSLHANAGIGGRNQELALQAAIIMSQMKVRQVVLCCIGTDGNDGPTDAAGAVVDGLTVESLPGDAKKALENHDAYSYLSQVDKFGFSPLLKVRRNETRYLSYLPKTGATETNVADLYMILVWP